MGITKRRIIILILAFVITFGIVLMAVPNKAYADAEVDFTYTNVLDDLRTSTTGESNFDIRNYPYDESKKPQVINFVEYCYSYKRNLRANYGLYVYVYNPQGLNFDTGSKASKIQMAVEYNEEGQALRYEKFSLRFCNKSTESNYNNLFYKFKVVDRKIDGKDFYDRVNSNERRYDVSGIELVTYGESSPQEYGVNGIYKFTGYAKGYGPDDKAENTLACNVEYLETIELDVKSTFYRTKTSSKGADYQNQLDTVYFSVPNRFFEEYGKLQKIKAEWYEYKTKDIVVTSNTTFYNKAEPYLGIQTGALNKYGFPAFNNNIRYSLAEDFNNDAYVMAARWGWNLGRAYSYTPCDTLYYLFKVDNISNYSPYGDTIEMGGVKSNALYQYILNYDKSFKNGILPIKNGTISADLFADDIDDYRKVDSDIGKIQKGYSYYDFDADVDLQKLTSWNDTQPSFWDNWNEWGFWDTITGDIPSETGKTISPIVTLKEDDVLGTNSEIVDRLLVNTQDVSSIKDFYEQSTAEDKTVVLFRFATSDYSSNVSIVKLDTDAGIDNTSVTNGQAYRAWESVFFDFDIIQLTFNKDGEYTVIPVVSNPIDIVNDITPPIKTSNGLDWLMWLLLLIVLVFVLIILGPYLPIILKVLWIVISFPFKVMGIVFKSIKVLVKKKRKKKKEKKDEKDT